MKWQDAVRLELGCPDWRPLPQDRLFRYLMKQLGQENPILELCLEGVSNKKKAAILLAIHGILNE